MQPITVSTTDATAGTTYSRKVRMDSWAFAQTIIQVDVTGTATYTVETSMDDPNSITNPVDVASMTWINAADSAIVAKTASAQGVLVATPTFIRIKQTAGNGSTTMTLAQFGNAPY
ncbi:MAG: hypothetical protein AMJ56_00330 [Anaerolineae bacterium SG8_19]|nr:MAG: hypothetical protein AMJ56_00330 [Anaerolineae bacterium SG8_19]